MNPKHLTIVRQEPVKLPPNPTLAIDFEAGITHVDPRSVLTDDQPLDEENVKVLTVAVKRDGVLTPVLLRRDKEGRLHVAAGRHRLAAAISAHLKSVPARIILPSVSLDRVTIAGIEENLCRRRASDAERANETAVRDRLLSEAGMDRKGQRDRAIAAQTGRSERTIRAERKRIEVLGIDSMKRLAGTSLGSGIELDTLVKISPPLRDTLIAKAISGQNVSAISEFAQLKASSKSKAFTDCERLMDAWTQAGPAGRSQFIRRIGAETKAASEGYRDALTALPREVGDDAADAWLARRTYYHADVYQTDQDRVDEYVRNAA